MAEKSNLSAGLLYPKMTFPLEDGKFKVTIIDTLKNSNEQKLVNYKLKSGKNSQWESGYIKVDNNNGIWIIHDKDGKVISTKEKNCELQFETAKHVIELIDSDHSNTFGNKEMGSIEGDRVKKVENIIELIEGKKRKLLYTQDKIQKTKRWKEGLISYDKTEKKISFINEYGEVIYKRPVSDDKITEELTACQFMFQIGDHVDELEGKNGERMENSSNSSIPSGKFSCVYSRDLGKKRPSWIDGFLDFCPGKNLLLLIDEGEKSFIWKGSLLNRTLEPDSTIKLGAFIVQLPASFDDPIASNNDNVITNELKQLLKKENTPDGNMMKKGKSLDSLRQQLENEISK